MGGPEQAAAWHKAGVANGGTSIGDRLACAKGPPASYISLIFAIPTATNCALSASAHVATADGGRPEPACYTIDRFPPEAQS